MYVKELALKTLQLSNFTEIYLKALDMLAQVTKTSDPGSSDEMDEFVSVFKEPAHVIEMQDELANVYADTYTEEELKALCVLYSEHPGVSEKMSMVMTASHQVGETLGQKWLEEHESTVAESPIFLDKEVN